MIKFEKTKRVLRSVKSASNISFGICDFNNFYCQNRAGDFEIYIGFSKCCSTCSAVKEKNNGFCNCISKLRKSALEYREPFFFECPKSKLFCIAVPIFDSGELRGCAVAEICHGLNQDNFDFSAEDAERFLRVGDIIFASVSDGENEQRRLTEEVGSIQSAGRYIGREYRYGITPASVARALGLNSSYLSREFKKHFHVTLTDYINLQRFNAAKKLLNTELPVYAIGRHVGFYDANYFVRAFKKHTGMTPGAYRKVHCPTFSEKN